MSGITLILEERMRQLGEEGWDAQHDDQWDGEELIQAAICYIDYDYPLHDKPLWPYGWNIAWFKPKDRIRNLTKAAALIAAEIDRLQRLEK